MKFIFFALVFVVFNSCSPSIHVYSDYDKEADIANYRNYSWLSEQAIEAKGSNPLFYNELNDKRIKKAVDKQLLSKGFLLSTGDQPLTLHYHIIVEDKSLVVKEPEGYNYSNYWQNKKETVYTYQEGTLIVDLMDSKTKALVWRGWATGVIENEVTKNPEKAIDQAVKKIFRLFPYNRY